ncbi:DsbA family protein [Bradyrhizobium sp. HKCCYLS20291]|uniref:DsbA family protein n=1 Tax=Bradyrhizobium sp. HKCCYLS20291 TaxID=3420766 RepID=UPI003EC07989
MRLTYLFDPLCGWCYGARPALDKLAELDDVALELLPTGLFADKGARMMDAQFASFAWRNDQRIAELTGQPFSEDYRKRVLGAVGPFDSAAASLGLTAVHVTDPAREMAALKELQLARYVLGQDIVSLTAVSELLRSIGLDDAAARLLSRNPEIVEIHSRRVQTAQTLMRRHGLTGVPALLVGDGPAQKPLRSNGLFEPPFDGLFAQLSAA